MIAIIDYKAGNLASVSNALDRLMADYKITHHPSVLDEADAIIFPGVGHAGSAMEDLKRNRLDSWLKQTRKPVLGICLGMELFYESTTEGPTETLGIIPGRLKKFDPGKNKVPHMGWNTITVQRPHPLMKSIEDNTHFYHVHSYYAPITPHTLATATYSETFSTAVVSDNYMGVQFHPEKSGIAGEKLLRNFLNLVYGGMRSIPA
ncbi:MAG: imidazole glycerol phosphate synthase subunit HisH [Balneolales bacterium]